MILRTLEIIINLYKSTEISKDEDSSVKLPTYKLRPEDIYADIHADYGNHGYGGNKGVYISRR